MASWGYTKENGKFLFLNKIIWNFFKFASVENVELFL